MKIHPQTIYNGKQAEFIVLPINEYNKLINLIEDFQDIQEVKLGEQSSDENFPMELVQALSDGYNPIKVYREYRGISQTALANKINVSKQYVSQLEKGDRVGSAKILLAIAKVLKIDLEDLA